MRLIASLGFAVVVPVVALVFGGAAIGDLRDDKTLVYFWLRPMDRWPVVVGAALAAMTLTAPITLIPVVLAAVLTGVGSGIVTGTIIAGVVAVIAYVSVFTLFGVWLKRFIVWGLAYILIWEGFIAQAGPGAARFALRKYTRSILVDRTGADLDLADFSLAVGRGRAAGRRGGGADRRGVAARGPGDRLSRPFRFGFQLSGEHAADPITAARHAEELGFDVVLVSDHVGPGLAPMTTLAAIAAATERIRLGTLVLNNDMRNPVQLAWEAVSLDRLSGGRFELGLGAGHTPQEYTATGIPLDPPAVRKARLVESLQVLRPLLRRSRELVAPAGTQQVHENDVAERVSTSASRCRIGCRCWSAATARVCSARRVNVADIIGLQGLGRTLEDGHRHEVNWTAAHLDDQIAQVRAGAGDRFDELEFNALVQVFSITDDRDRGLREITDPRPESLDRRCLGDPVPDDRFDRRDRRARPRLPRSVGHHLLRRAGPRRVRPRARTIHRVLVNFSRHGYATSSREPVHAGRATSP